MNLSGTWRLHTSWPCCSQRRGSACQARGAAVTQPGRCRQRHPHRGHPPLLPLSPEQEHRPLQTQEELLRPEGPRPWREELLPASHSLAGGQASQQSLRSSWGSNEKVLLARALPPKISLHAAQLLAEAATATHLLRGTCPSCPAPPESLLAGEGVGWPSETSVSSPVRWGCGVSVNSAL